MNLLNQEVKNLNKNFISHINTNQPMNYIYKQIFINGRCIVKCLASYKNKIKMYTELLKKLSAFLPDVER